MADKKEEKKPTEFVGTATTIFKLKGKQYKKNDKVVVKNQESLDYLKSIHKVK